MPRTCTIYGHGKRKAIDAAIASGTSYRNIAVRFGVSTSAIARHRQHVAATIQKAAERREESIGESVLSRLESLYHRAEKILDGAEKRRDGRLALASVRELRETLAGIFTLASRLATPAATPDELRAIQIHVRYEKPSFEALSGAELDTLEALLAKAQRGVGENGDRTTATEADNKLLTQG